jgi:NADPH-dependent 2,4-dienoyl-CoA reductase/sulfur reductase-like enzyme
MHHVIIGGGPAATNAIETIREFDGGGRPSLLGDEPAHSRWRFLLAGGTIPEAHTTPGMPPTSRGTGRDPVGVRVTAVDRGKTVMLADGASSISTSC